MKSTPTPARLGALWTLMLAAAALPAHAAHAAHAAHTAHTACDYLRRAVTAQPDAALLLASYPTAGDGALHRVAFTYDNAVAAIALVGCGQLALGRRIGDAFLLALDHDRYWHDGRMRNAYAAGPVGPGPLKLAGWWDAKSQRWLEDGYQAGSDSGNMAWAMLALLALHQASGDERYLRGALRLGRWVEGALDARGAGGFRGGRFGHEPSPQRLDWKSTEHNADLAAAFAWLARTTSDEHWRRQASAAARFVDAMWIADCGCFAVGTTLDGVTVNPRLALDAQVWPLLALPGASRRYAAALKAASGRLRFDDGYTYSEAGTGVWTEGTAQVAVLLELLPGRPSALSLLAAIERQRTAGGGYYASSAASMDTGFVLATDPAEPRVYFRLEHLGAAAWAALAQSGLNPFAAAHRLPP